MSARTLTSAAVACLVPVVLAGNALLLLAWGWLPRALYALPGFPDGDGLAGDDRLALATTGVDAIQPWDAGGMDGLRAALLPGGAPAFNAREIAHMQDVRGVVTGLLIAWVVAVVLLAVAWLAGRGLAGLVGRRAEELKLEVQSQGPVELRELAVEPSAIP